MATSKAKSNDTAANLAFKEVLADADETLSVEWTDRHYVQDDEYITHGEDIEAFLKREIAKPIIRWADSPQLGYEILPNNTSTVTMSPRPRKTCWRSLEAGERGGENAGGTRPMKKKSDNTLLITPEYRQFIEELKSRVISAQISAARRINNELSLLYWDIGRGIVEKQKTLGWGDSVVEMVAADLQKAFPGTKGFSPQNVWRMLQFYLVHTEKEFLSQVARDLEKAGQSLPDSEKLSQLVRAMVAAVPWGHHASALTRVTDPAARLWYLRATARFGWSRNVLRDQIKASNYRVVSKKALE